MDTDKIVAGARAALGRPASAYRTLYEYENALMAAVERLAEAEKLLTTRRTVPGAAEKLDELLTVRASIEAFVKDRASSKAEADRAAAASKASLAESMKSVVIAEDDDEEDEASGLPPGATRRATAKASSKEAARAEKKTNRHASKRGAGDKADESQRSAKGEHMGERGSSLTLLLGEADDDSTTKAAIKKTSQPGRHGKAAVPELPPKPQWRWVARGEPTVVTADDAQRLWAATFVSVMSTGGDYQKNYAAPAVNRENSSLTDIRLTPRSTGTTVTRTVLSVQRAIFAAALQASFVRWLASSGDEALRGANSKAARALAAVMSGDARTAWRDALIDPAQAPPLFPAGSNEAVEAAKAVRKGTMARKHAAAATNPTSSKAERKKRSGAGETLPGAGGGGHSTSSAGSSAASDADEDHTGRAVVADAVPPAGPAEAAHEDNDDDEFVVVRDAPDADDEATEVDSLGMLRQLSQEAVTDAMEEQMLQGVSGAQSLGSLGGRTRGSTDGIVKTVLSNATMSEHDATTLAAAALASGAPLGSATGTLDPTTLPVEKHDDFSLVVALPPHHAFFSTLSLLPRAPWAIVMCHGGYFAAAIFVNGVAVAHRSLHRYVVRRGQGGKQSNQEGIASSAGSLIRRSQEIKFRSDVRDVLDRWRPLIQRAWVIAYAAPGPDNKRILADWTDAPKSTRFATLDSPISIQGVSKAASFIDPRVTSIPFTTHRPTGQEVKRAYEQLQQWSAREEQLLDGP